MLPPGIDKLISADPESAEEDYQQFRESCWRWLLPLLIFGGLALALFLI